MENEKYYKIEQYRSPWTVPILKFLTHGISGLIILSNFFLGILISVPFKTLLWIVWIVLSVLLLFYQCRCVKELNQLCQEYETDTSNVSPNYLLVLLLSVFTFSIYGFYWYYKQGNRIRFVGKKAGIYIKDSGSKYLVLALLNSFLFGIPIPMVWYSIFQSRNQLAKAYLPQSEEVKSENKSVVVQEEEKSVSSDVPKEQTRKSALMASGKICVLSGANKGMKVPVNLANSITIGRSPLEANLIVKGKKVSRRHCTIGYDEKKQRYMIVDYSSNGTYFMSGLRLTPLETVFAARKTEIYLGNKDNIIRLE